MKNNKITNVILQNDIKCDIGLIDESKVLATVDNTKTKSMEKKDLQQSWHEIDWRKAEQKLQDLQEKIVIATIDNNIKEVYKLQWLLINSFEAKALAIRKVITNKGKNTAGTDGITWKSPNEYYTAIRELTSIVTNVNKYKAKPLLRVYIPKGNTGEKRPLGIPSMIDRAIQALYHFGVDPVVETRSDPNSFGFRKSRSTHDAITAIRSLLDKKNHPRWILEADIAKCFDKIDHGFLMKHTPICHKNVLEQWLKSGIMEELNYFETTEGTPQGGIISPTLCNIALNGIEEVIKKANPLKKGISAGVHVIRYADDMIITGKTEEIVKRNRHLLADFLKERGLSLNEKKTLITHVKNGFDFLGFNIKRMPWDPLLNKETEQETVLIIRPSKKGIDKLKDSLRKIIVMNKPLVKIISEANPIIRGWAEHKRISYHSQEVFITLDHWIYTKMKKWAYWMKGSIKEKIKKYVMRTETRAWNWAVSAKIKLINMGEIPIINLRPLKLARNPYLSEHSKYFNERREQLIFAKFRAMLYKDYKQTCPVCDVSLHNGEIVELHHIVPQKAGGKYSRENIIPLHQICHQQLTHGITTLVSQRTAEALKKSTFIKEKAKNTIEGKIKKQSRRQKQKLILEEIG